jgi:chemotaxis protein methyltransferase CheR
MPIATHEYEYIRELVRQRSGIVLEAGKEYLVDSRLTPLARREGYANAEELLGNMRTGPKALSLQYKVIEAMTTNETSFFRDIHPFESLRDTVIPELLKARSASRTLNIWCAASSSGQEPYTIAMVLKEHFGHLFGTGGGWKLRFVATDLSGEMVRRSREGKYTQLEINRGLPAALMVKYFKRHGMEWQIDESLRKMIEFRELNLCEDWPTISEMDVVFMRNVLIYFSLETKRQILGKVRRSMRPDGYLFLGGAETTINIDDAYDRVQLVKGGVYQVRRAA